ncbi:MAG TPA: hydroxymethylbilane synthase, partial [Planctomycetota bacterium]|nr:hydroxymethylbilane synthase [Planctomycetota bacterium]
CQAPAGALATISQEERLEIEGVIAAPDGSTHVRGRIEGLPEDAPTLGVRLAHELLGRGGAEILRLLGRI